jgi:hypothetical protein
MKETSTAPRGDAIPLVQLLSNPHADCTTPSLRNSPVAKSHQYEKGQNLPLKNAVFWDVTPCGSVLQQQHGVTSKQTAFSIVTAVKTLNLT